MAQSKRCVLVPGGAGFIGSHFVDLVHEKGYFPVVLDALTYSGNRDNLKNIPEREFAFVEGNICDAKLVEKVFKDFPISGVINFAAETHVDRSITGPMDFVMTNVLGTSILLNEALKSWEKDKPAGFRFVQVSTDEVYGSLEEGFFSETSPYAPNSPYSASKAGADFLCRAWFKTYGFPTVVTHCSNNYGPRQYPEKLIPAMITRALKGESLGVYGDGKNVRDWLHVKDHCEGIWLAYEKGRAGESYCFGGDNELENLTLVHELCKILDETRPRPQGTYKDLIRFVTDRLGHDRRYAIDFSKAKKELGFSPRENFTQGFFATIRWYLDNPEWIESSLRKENQ